MSNYILMVFEGEETEKIIFDSLKQYFLNENTNTIVYGFHCGEIYSLYHKLYNDGDLELFPLLKESLQSKNIELQDIYRDEVSEIYLFFDYDGHASAADDIKLDLMLELFSNETENGKLYISYPMVEAIKHLQNNIEFQLTISESNKEYKQLVSECCDDEYKNLNSLTQSNWNMIIDQHCKKINFIMVGDFVFPCDLFEQEDLFSNQIKIKNMNDNQVSVLSSFPVMLMDYYGCQKLREMIVEP